jgi:spore coat protein A
VDYYKIVMGEYRQQLHPQLSPTRLWGYADATAGDPVWRHLGPVIVARKGTPVRASFINDLPLAHPLPVDTTLPGAELTPNRAVAHLHGGHVPWPSDGGPFAWFAPDGTQGPSRIAWLPDGDGSLTYDHYYPNDQSARLMWYHDHAMGITRLNAYAGLASAYVLRDEVELNLISSGALPAREIPLVIQDKTFKQVGDEWGGPGDLWYPSTYDPADLSEDHEPGDLPVPSCVPEFFGDTMLVNGLVFPYLEVEPRRYRLRILNACNARFCRLELVYAQSSTFPGSTEPAVNKPGPVFLQVGTEGGFLPASTGPVTTQTLLLAPAERADLIVDFSQVAPGSTLILYNDAPAPFPSGDPASDYFPGNRKNPAICAPGYGPNTRTLLQFRVLNRVGPKDPPPGKLKLPNIPLLSEAGVPVRNLTLNEDFDDFGRLIQRLGTAEAIYPGTFARNYMDDPTETPQAGSVEVWRIFNLTGDTHPVHFHLVNVQVMGRQAFNWRRFHGVPRFEGPLRPPEPNETGWKETVRMNPGEMTQVIMMFDPPPVPGVPVPLSPRTGGHEYVWHCHILEHEEHDMMRPLVVV